MGSFNITKLKTEYLENPIGLDCGKPRFSWRMESDIHGKRQHSYRIQVASVPDSTNDMWDSGEIVDSRSIEIEYQGRDLCACTCYYWTITVSDASGEQISAKSWFETGLLNSTKEVWEGAQWIGPDKNNLHADKKGIFRIESTFRIAEGSNTGGIVFGANDPRLTDPYKNTFLISGENYISYVIDISTIPVKLNIYRVGYDKNDSQDIPLASIEVVDIDNKKNTIITERNRHDFHTLAVEVYGNHAMALIDGIKVDAIEEPLPWDPGKSMERGRQLNPLGMNDVITYPRLNEIGFIAPNDSTAFFKDIQISDIRTPGEVVFLEKPDDNKGVFFSAVESGDLEIEQECYKLTGRLITRNPSHTSIPMLRRSFAVKENTPLITARLYVTARGIYEGHINGKLLSEDLFQPGSSQYDKHLYYQTYDITEHLAAGENAIGFYLASGWWSDSQTYSLMNYNYYGDRPSLLAKLVLTYQNKLVETIVTDSLNWKYSGDGPVLYASFFHGEKYDARLSEQYKDFSEAVYDDSRWSAPDIIKPIPIMTQEKDNMWPRPNYTKPKIIGQCDRPIKKVLEITSKSMIEARPGIYIYDMEQNMVGVPRIKIKGRRGQVITLRYCESLYPKLEEYGKLEGLPLMENLRDASCTDIYICRGDEEGEEYMPRFTFHGYRYVEISGSDIPPVLEEVRGVVISSVIEPSGSFKCSDPMVNKLYENILWSQRGNFISIPTDCPQRNERMGWMGDAQVFAKTALYNADVRLLYYRFMQAARDVQSREGRYADIAPVGGGFGGIVWGSAGIIIPWEVYRQYGDLKIIKDNYEAMKRYMCYLENNYNSEEGVLEDGVGYLGDWLASDMSTDNELIWNAYYAYNAKIMAKMAGVIGEDKDRESYQSLFENLKKDWNERFIDKKNGKTLTISGEINDTQCSYALPLAYGIIDDKYEFVAAENLNRKTKELGCTLTTGFVGTGQINSVLTEYGYADTAYQLLRQTQYPSWLYSVTQGATTIWERWNSYTIEGGYGGNNSMNSFNHYSLGAVGAWLYDSVLGIRSDEQKPGYQHFVLKPYMTGMEYAGGHFDCPYGCVKSSWKYTENSIVYHITIPANTTATIYLPIGKITENGKQLVDVKGISGINKSEGYKVFTAQSGTYCFEIEVTNLC